MSQNMEINREARWSIAVSVIMIFSGALAIMVSLASGILATIVVGWLLVISGVSHLAHAWDARSAGGFWWRILLGIIYIATGSYILLRPLAGLVSLTTVLAACFFTEAVLEFVLAFCLRRLRGARWLLLDGILTLALAVLILRTWPASAAWVIGTLVGIKILCSGITRLMLSLAARRQANQSRAGLHEMAKGP